MSEFSVATDTTGATTRSSTRRTEALYLEANLRQARKEQLYEMHCEQGATFQPETNSHKSKWREQVTTNQDVVSRLYNPRSEKTKQRRLDRQRESAEMRGFTGNSLRVTPSLNMEWAPFMNRLHRLHLTFFVLSALL